MPIQGHDLDFVYEDFLDLGGLTDSVGSGPDDLFSYPTDFSTEDFDSSTLDFKFDPKTFESTSFEPLMFNINDIAPISTSFDPPMFTLHS